MAKAKYMPNPATMKRAKLARAIEAGYNKTHSDLVLDVFLPEFGVKDAKPVDGLLKLSKAQASCVNAHLREKAHYQWFARDLRTDDDGEIIVGGTWRYKQFVKFAKAYNGGVIPTADGRGKTKGKRAVSPLVQSNTTHERIEGLCRDIAALIKGVGFIDAELLATARNIVESVKAFDKAQQKDIKASVAQAARDEAAIAKAARDSTVEIAA